MNTMSHRIEKKKTRSFLFLCADTLRIKVGSKKKSRKQCNGKGSKKRISLTAFLNVCVCVCVCVNMLAWVATSTSK